MRQHAVRTGPIRGVVYSIVAGLAAAVAASLAAAEPAGKYPVVVEVTRTYDGRPFSYRIESASQRPGYTMYRLTYPSPVVTAIEQNNTVPAEYYVPPTVRPGGPKLPAVISMHILDGNMELVRMTCTVLATRGIPSLLFKLPYYGERGPPEGPKALAKDPGLIVSSLTQGMEDMRRTIDLLASRPEIDPGKIGINGISLGAIVAATAAGREPRLGRVLLALSGGDLLTMIHHARETEELSKMLKALPADRRARFEETIRSVDPLQHAGALRDRASRGRVVMINAANDELIPRACTMKLATALGIEDRIEWLDGLGHYTAMAALPQMLERMADFFAEDLPPGTRIRPPPPAVRTPTQIVLAILGQATDFLLSEPARGKCHFADLALTLTPDGDKKSYEGRLLVVRGWEGRFKLQAKAPVVGDVALGQGKFPWMVSARKTIFQGTTGAPSPPKDPLTLADPKYLLRVRAVAGAIGGAALAPDILDPLAAIAEGQPVQGRRTIRVTLKGRGEGTLTFQLQEDGKTPRLLTFAFPGARGTLTFRTWQLHTPTQEAIFDPPGGLAVKHVEAAELTRIFSALFNFAMESAE